MKTLIATLLLSTSAFAYDYSFDREISYVSWCSENQVIVNSSKNELIVLADCNEKGLTCKEQTRPQGRVMIVTASCKAN